MLYYGALKVGNRNFDKWIQPVEAESAQEAMDLIRKFWGPGSCGTLVRLQDGDDRCKMTLFKQNGEALDLTEEALSQDSTGDLIKVFNIPGSYMLITGWDRDWPVKNQGKVRPVIEGSWFGKDKAYGSIGTLRPRIKTVEGVQV